MSRHDTMREERWRVQVFSWVCSLSRWVCSQEATGDEPAMRAQFAAFDLKGQRVLLQQRAAGAARYQDIEERLT